MIKVELSEELLEKHWEWFESNYKASLIRFQKKQTGSDKYFWDYVVNNLKTIITGKPHELREVIKFFNKTAYYGANLQFFRTLAGKKEDINKNNFSQKKIILNTFAMHLGLCFKGTKKDVTRTKEFYNLIAKHIKTHKLYTDLKNFL